MPKIEGVTTPATDRWHPKTSWEDELSRLLEAMVSLVKVLEQKVKENK
jgi:hypothetical protein